MRKYNYFDLENPGDFYWASPSFYFLCPCGCKTVAGITINPPDPNGLEWNEDENHPTVRPSIDINHGHWHGYLAEGKFKLC